MTNLMRVLMAGAAYLLLVAKPEAATYFCEVKAQYDVGLDGLISPNEGRLKWEGKTLIADEDQESVLHSGIVGGFHWKLEERGDKKTPAKFVGSSLLEGRPIEVMLTIEVYHEDMPFLYINLATAGLMTGNCTTKAK